MRQPKLYTALFCLLSACSESEETFFSSSSSSTSDGDTETPTGDGDTGEPTGDGDESPGDGDGDGSAGDGDTGEPAGDGDGSTGDGDTSDGDTAPQTGDGDSGDGDGSGALEPYSDPADGGCLPSEEALTVPGVKGSICAQPCESFGDDCPQSDFGSNPYCLGSAGDWQDFSGTMHCLIRGCSLDSGWYPCEDGAQCRQYGTGYICTW